MASPDGIQFESSTAIEDTSASCPVAPTGTIRVQRCLTERLQGGG